MGERLGLRLSDSFSIVIKVLLGTAIPEKVFAILVKFIFVHSLLR